MNTLKTLIGVCAAIFIMIVLFAIFGTPADTPPTPTVKISEQDQITNSIKDIVELSSDKLKKVELKPVDGENNQYIVFVSYIDKFGGQEKQIKWIMGDIYLTIYKNFHNITLVVISAYLPVIDKYGNQSEINGYETQLGGDDINKINWNLDDNTLKYQVIPGLWDLNKLSPLIELSSDQ